MPSGRVGLAMTEEQLHEFFCTIEPADWQKHPTRPDDTRGRLVDIQNFAFKLLDDRTPLW